MTMIVVVIIIHAILKFHPPFENKTKKIRFMN